MKKCGICGNIGSGKSYISNLFEKYGVPIFNFDNEAKKVMTKNLDIRDRIKDVFGDVYNRERVGQGFNDMIKYTLKKEELSKIIFSDEYKLRQLESIIKPELLKSFYDFCYVQEFEKNKPFIVAESATIIKTGLYKMFDEIILVDAFVEKRKEMVTTNRGMTEEDFDKRDESQLPFSNTLSLLDSSNQKYKLFINEYDNKSEQFVLDYIKTNI